MSSSIAKRALSLFLVCSSILPAAGATGEHDIAAEFLQLQERLMAEQARFAARQAETRRLAVYAWSESPPPDSCARFNEINKERVQFLATSNARQAARLVDRVAGRMLAASGLSLPALCPGAIGGASIYNAHSFVQDDPRVHVPDADEAASRARSLKAVVLDRGMILAAGSDDELAAVIGHELGHLALQHLRARAEISRLGDGAAFAAGLGAPAADIAKRRMRWWGEGYLVETEMEADRFGAQIMARAGYDPSEFAAVLAKAEPAALALDERGAAAVRADFARRNAAAARFAAEFPTAAAAPLRVLERLKALLR